MSQQVENVSTPRPQDAAGAPAGVLVGVDGSAAAQQALLFAAREAQLRDTVLTIVAAHDMGAMAYGYAGGFGSGFSMGPVEDGLREAAEALVKAAADTVTTDLPGPSIHVRTLVVRGRPHVLLDAAVGAALLVVGARGAGALTRLMMGSTSTEVVHGAHLPVTVVPTEDPERS